MSDWLEKFNSTAQLMQECRHAEAIEILNELEPTIRAQPELTPNTYVLFELRRAALYSSLGVYDESLARFQSAMKLAFHEVQDPLEVQVVVKKTLDTICEWQKWALLLKIARNMMTFAQQHAAMQLVGVTAAWYLPYAYRGLGETELAREHATAILERLEGHHAEAGSAGWREFLQTLDDPLSS